MLHSHPTHTSLIASYCKKLSVFVSNICRPPLVAIVREPDPYKDTDSIS